MSMVSPLEPNRWTYETWFRMTFVFVGGMEVLFGALTFLQGPRQLMSQFGIPELVLDSPHYIDAMSWVLLHMTFLGAIQITLGALANERRLMRRLPRLFLLFHFVYAFLDVRASDNPLGTALYQGSASQIPAVFSCLFFLLFLNLALRSLFAPGNIDSV